MLFLVVECTTFLSFESEYLLIQFKMQFMHIPTCQDGKTNQTRGPNAHLIFKPGISTKHTKPEDRWSCKRSPDILA